MTRTIFWVTKDVRLTHAEGAKLGAHGGCDRRIHVHVRHERVGIRLTCFAQILNMINLGCKVAKLERFRGVGCMLAPNRADRRSLGFRGNEEDSALTAILGRAEDLDGPPEDDLADLRAKTLKRAPTNDVER